jgi:hypothetical protein
MTDEDRANAKAWLDFAMAQVERDRQRTGLAQPTLPTVEPFASQADMTSAMADPQYKTDPNYRRAVAERTAAMRGRRL